MCPNGLRARRAHAFVPSDDQTSIFVRTRAMTSSVNSVVEAWPPRSGVRTPDAGRLEHALVDRARGAARRRSTPRHRRRSAAPRRAARIIAIGFAMSLPSSAGAVPCGASAIATCVSKSSSNASRTDSAPGDRAEHRHHEVRQAVAVAVERRDHERPGRGAGDQPRVRRVDQDRLVVDVGVALGGGVELLLEHPLVHGRDRPLRPAVDARRPSARAVRNAYSATARQVAAA